jgi:hypothetical protein
MMVAQILVENARNLRESTAMVIGSENGVIIDSVNQNGTNSVGGITNEKADIQDISRVVTKNTIHRTVAHRETTETEIATGRGAKNTPKMLRGKRSIGLRNIIANQIGMIGDVIANLCPPEARIGMTLEAGGNAQEVFLLTMRKTGRRNSYMKTKSRKQ